MSAELRLVERDRDGVLPTAFAPPPVSLEPCAPRELRAFVHAGENESDTCERVLAQVARVEGALELAIGDGLDALSTGTRLVALGFRSVGDYAAEILDVKERTAQALVQLARALRDRPLLRAAVRAGEVRLRHAQTILPVAVGEGEAEWVEAARHTSVRALEQAVRATCAGAEPPPDEQWFRLRVRLTPADRAAVDDALAVAATAMSGASRAERLEAIAQEFIAEHPLEAGDDGALGGAFRPDGGAVRARLEAAAEAEAERWAYLPRPADVPAPDASFDEYATAWEIHARLREVALQRAAWDGILGYCAYVVRRAGLWRTAGFETFEQYCDLCRSRHNSHYADSRLMPRRALQPARAWADRARGAA